MKKICIIVLFVLIMFANSKAIAEKKIQIDSASEVLRTHCFVVFDTQSIDLDDQNPHDETVGISLINVDKKSEVTIDYKGQILKAKEDCVFPSLIKNGILVVSYAGRDRGDCYASLELYIPKKELQHRYHMQQLLSILLGKQKTVNNDSDSNDLGAALRDTLTKYRGLKTNLEFPMHLIDKEGEKQGDEYDVEKYFTVLKHISMKEDYRLDYVYHLAGIGGSPILYSRRENQSPYINYEEYINAVRKEAHLDEINSIDEDFSKKIDTIGITAANEWRKTQLEQYPNYRHQEWYLDDIRVDGTTQGWLELIVLHLLGDQFYLFWHANYNDTMIIPDYDALASVSDQTIVRERKVSPIISLLGSSLDVRPLVKVGDETVSVSIVTFSKWGGFSEQVFSINKEQPHRITRITDNTLIAYHCHLVF